jgi:hypothetical protein
VLFRLRAFPGASTRSPIHHYAAVAARWIHLALGTVWRLRRSRTRFSRYFGRPVTGAQPQPSKTQAECSVARPATGDEAGGRRTECGEIRPDSAFIDSKDVKAFLIMMGPFLVIQGCWRAEREWRLGTELLPKSAHTEYVLLRPSYDEQYSLRIWLKWKSFYPVTGP